jgi:NADH-quinone oxidoreductase subunit M
MNVAGLQGGIIQMISHGVNVVGVFFIIDVIESRTRNRDINGLGGIAHKAPQLAIYFMIVMLASVALPLTNGFIGEFLLLNSLSTYSYWYAGIAGLTIILGAIYMLTVYKKVMFGEVNIITEKFTDLKLTEKAVLIPIVVMIFWIGLYPKPFLQVAQPAVENLIMIINK